MTATQHASVSRTISSPRVGVSMLAIVDAADAHLLDEHSWRPLRLAGVKFRTFQYATRAVIGGRNVSLHALVMGPLSKGQAVYAKNGNLLDCRRSNLWVGKRGEYPRTEEHRRLCAEAGRASAKSAVNAERYAAMSDTRTCPECATQFRFYRSVPKRYCTLSCWNRSITRREFSVQTYRSYLTGVGGFGMTGRTHSAASRERMSIAKRRKHLSPATEFKRHPNTPLKTYVRSSAAYKAWRKSVMLRDNFTCVACGATRVPLEADHIKPFAIFVRHRLDIMNGRTLCQPCHKETPTYGKNPFQLKRMFGEEVPW